MNPNSPMQTLVVHMDQLTPENLIQLGQAGYTILRDVNLLIFARPLPEQPASLNGAGEEGIMEFPVPSTS